MAKVYLCCHKKLRVTYVVGGGGAGWGANTEKTSLINAEFNWH